MYVVSSSLLPCRAGHVDSLALDRQEIAQRLVDKQWVLPDMYMENRSQWTGRLQVETNQASLGRLVSLIGESGTDALAKDVG